MEAPLYQLEVEVVVVVAEEEDHQVDQEEEEAVEEVDRAVVQDQESV